MRSFGYSCLLPMHISAIERFMETPTRNAEKHLQNKNIVLYYIRKNKSTKRWEKASRQKNSVCKRVRVTGWKHARNGFLLKFHFGAVRLNRISVGRNGCRRYRQGRVSA